MIFHVLIQTLHSGSAITLQLTGDLVPSIFEVGSATGILTPTLMGTVILQLTDDEGVTHSFEFTNA